MRTVALIISSILHPAFIPLMGFLLLYYFSGYALYLPENVFWFSVLIIVQFTILIPISTVYFLFWRKKITSIELSNREERPLPLVINLVSYSISFLVFRYLNYPDIIVSFFAAIVISAAFSMFVSLSYKISLHLVAWGTLLGVMLAFVFRVGLELHFLISLIILLSALVASARLWLNEHNLEQTIYAWVSGGLISFLIMTYL